MPDDKKDDKATAADKAAADRVAAEQQAAGVDPLVGSAPAKEPEPAAPAGAEPNVQPGLAPGGQGAQVILTGDAQAAARGGLHGDVTANTAARDAAIAAGHVVVGTTANAAAEAISRSVPVGEPGAEAPTAADAGTGTDADAARAKAAADETARTRRENKG